MLTGTFTEVLDGLENEVDLSNDIFEVLCHLSANYILVEGNNWKENPARSGEPYFSLNVERCVPKRTETELKGGSTQSMRV